MKELNKTIQDLKNGNRNDIEITKQALLEIENLGKISGVINASITNRLQEIEERISGTEDIIENIDTTVKQNAKCKKFLTPKLKEI